MTVDTHKHLQARRQAARQARRERQVTEHGGRRERESSDRERWKSKRQENGQNDVGLAAGDRLRMEKLGLE